MTENKVLEFEVVECCNCHVQFCMTQEHNRSLITNKETFYCPNGHPQSYTGKSDRKVIGELKQKINFCSIRKNELLSELESKEKSIRSYKMLYAKEKKKAQKQS